jgi:hypothetical protein
MPLFQVVRDRFTHAFILMFGMEKDSNIETSKSELQHEKLPHRQGGRGGAFSRGDRTERGRIHPGKGASNASPKHKLEVHCASGAEPCECLDFW